MRPDCGAGVLVTSLLLHSITAWHPLPVSLIQKRSGVVAGEGRRNNNQPRPQPRPHVEEVRIRLQTENEELLRSHNHGLTVADDQDIRGKRFIDPDEVVDHMEDHDHDHDNIGGVKDGVSKDNTTQDLDPHLRDQQFCVDISEYLDLRWVLKDAEECHVHFTSQCETKSENVCLDVTETKCEVVPYKDCAMGLEPQEFVEKKLAPKLFVEKSCYQGKKTIPHKKQFPECRNVTKQNCVTLWETDENGEQIWAGTDQCEPVTWQECELVERDVQFIVPDVSCSNKQELWYHEPEPTRQTKMTKTFTCTVKKSSNCITQTRPDCKQITYNECREVPVNKCKTKKFHVPTQELLHRKKCLLPDDVKLHSGADSDYGAPVGGGLSSYRRPRSRHLGR